MAARRERVRRGILDAAWTVMRRRGVAAVNVREVARALGIRQQSLTYYFPTKQDLLDALFADGFDDLRRRFVELPTESEPDAAVITLATAFVDYCVTHAAGYHLMFQRTVPGFEPSDRSHAVALGVLSVLRERLAAAGITDEADVAVVRSLMSGLAAEQIANDPEGRLFADQTARAIGYVVRELRSNGHSVRVASVPDSDAPDP